MLAWLAVLGILVLFTLALTWLAVIPGLTAKTVDGAGAFAYPLIFLPFVSSAFVPTAGMPGPVRAFAEHQPVTSIVDTHPRSVRRAAGRRRHLDRARLVRRHAGRRVRARAVDLPPQDRLTAERMRDRAMLTIGQLASYAGVTVRAVRHYHPRGLLPEPERDNSGYRSYDAAAVVELIRIRTLAEAGVPLARVRELLDADPETFAAATAEIDRQLRAQIRELPAHRGGSRSWPPAIAGHAGGGGRLPRPAA